MKMKNISETESSRQFECRHPLSTMPSRFWGDSGLNGFANVCGHRGKNRTSSHIHEGRKNEHGCMIVTISLLVDRVEKCHQTIVKQSRGLQRNSAIPTAAEIQQSLLPQKKGIINSNLPII